MGWYHVHKTKWATAVHEIQCVAWDHTKRDTAWHKDICTSSRVFASWKEAEGYKDAGGYQRQAFLIRWMNSTLGESNKVHLVYLLVVVKKP
jgi:hypothetical protein